MFLFSCVCVSICLWGCDSLIIGILYFKISHKIVNYTIEIVVKHDSYRGESLENTGFNYILKFITI